MKRNRLSKSLSAKTLRLLACIFAAALPISAHCADSTTKVEESKIMVNMNDLQGSFDPDAKWVREDLLRTAFYDAAEDKVWLGEYEFTYNAVLPKNPRNWLEVTVQHWKRHAAGFFNFTASLAFYDADGEKINLGSFDGSKSGISVIHARDIPEHFASAAESALEDALEKLHERMQ